VRRTLGCVGAEAEASIAENFVFVGPIESDIEPSSSTRATVCRALWLSGQLPTDSADVPTSGTS